MSTGRTSIGGDLAKHYRALLAEQARSELSVAAFAEGVGVSAATLYAWRRRLSGSSSAGVREDEGNLLEVEVSDNEVPTPAPSPVVLTIDGRLRIELAGDFDVVALGRLLGLVAPC